MSDRHELQVFEVIAIYRPHGVVWPPRGIDSNTNSCDAANLEESQWAGMAARARSKWAADNPY